MMRPSCWRGFDGWHRSDYHIDKCWRLDILTRFQNVKGHVIIDMPLFRLTATLYTRGVRSAERGVSFFLKYFLTVPVVCLKDQDIRSLFAL